MSELERFGFEGIDWEKNKDVVLPDNGDWIPGPPPGWVGEFEDKDENEKPQENTLEEKKWEAIILRISGGLWLN